MNPIRNSSAQSGLTLIEVSIAILLIGTSVMGAVTLLRAVIPGVVMVHHRSIGTQLAQAQTEALRNQIYMQSWWYINATNTTSTPTPGSGTPDPQLVVVDNTKFRTNWDITFLDASGSLAPFPTPVNTSVPDANTGASAPTNLIRIHVNTSWTDRKNTRTVDLVNYVDQRDFTTPTAPTPTPVQFFTISGKITDSGKNAVGGALVVASTNSNPTANLQSILGPSYTHTDRYYVAYLNTDGSYVISIPADSSNNYYVACWYDRLGSNGQITELTGTVQNCGLASAGGSANGKNWSF